MGIQGALSRGSVGGSQQDVNHCQFGVKALVAQGKIVESNPIRRRIGARASTTAGHCRCGLRGLAAVGWMVEERISVTGFLPTGAGTYLATFRAVAEEVPAQGRCRDPGRPREEHAGDEGKWFAAAKEAGLSTKPWYWPAARPRSENADPCSPRLRREAVSLRRGCRPAGLHCW